MTLLQHPPFNLSNRQGLATHDRSSVPAARLCSDLIWAEPLDFLVGLGRGLLGPRKFDDDLPDSCPHPRLKLASHAANLSPKLFQFPSRFRVRQNGNSTSRHAPLGPTGADLEIPWLPFR